MHSLGYYRAFACIQAFLLYSLQICSAILWSVFFALMRPSTQPAPYFMWSCN